MRDFRQALCGKMKFDHFLFRKFSEIFNVWKGGGSKTGEDVKRKKIF